jgi:hypothetical protein
MASSILRVFTVRKLNLVDLGHAFDDVRHLLAELRRDVRSGDRSIFDRIMQQARRDGRRIELHLRQHQRYFKRMQHVRLARGAKLPFVMLKAEFPGLANDLKIVVGTVRAHRVQEFAKLLRKQILTTLGSERGALRGYHVSLYAL